ncbi:MAG: phage holin family protein [Bacteroidota bacterium]
MSTSFFTNFFDGIKTFGIQILISTLAIYFTDYLFDSVEVDKFTTAIMVSVFLSFFNSYLKPVLVALTIPLTIFSLGIFLIVINAGLIMLTAHFVPGFKVDGFWHAFWFSIVLSLMTSFLQGFKGKSAVRVKTMKKEDDKFDDYEEIK